MSALDSLIEEQVEAADLAKRRAHAEKIKAGAKTGLESRRRPGELTTREAAAEIGITESKLSGYCMSGSLQARGEAPPFRHDKISAGDRGLRFFKKDEITGWWVDYSGAPAKPAKKSKPAVRSVKSPRADFDFRDPIEAIRGRLADQEKQITILTSENARLKQKLSAIRKMSE